MQLKKSLALCAVLLASSWAQALTVIPYTPGTLAKLQTAGEPVALHFRADWCPTCRAQDKSLQALKADPALALTVLSVDYDKEAELQKHVNVRSQSTFIVYRGKIEKARNSGEVSVDGIRKILRAAL